jgi:hypothetical protein
MAEPGITIEEFAALAKGAGLELDAARLAELHAGYRFVAAMKARVRGTAARDAAAEPAVLFKAEG